MTNSCSLNTESFYHGLLESWEFSYSASHQGWEGQRELMIVITPELLIWHFLVLFQHQIQPYKQNLTNLNYVYEYFPVTYVLTHPKTTFSNINQQKNIVEKIWQCTWITGISVFNRILSCNVVVKLKALIYLFIWKHQNNMPSWLSPQWLYDSSITWDKQCTVHH